jgi:uncharacterized protein DUF5658
VDKRRIDKRPSVDQEARGVGASVLLWTLFWLLAALQAMDLGTTMAVVAAGAHEANPVLRGLLFTPVAPVLKAAPLVFLAILIVRSTKRGRPAPARLLIATRLTVLIYLAIVSNNLILILRAR